MYSMFIPKVSHKMYYLAPVGPGRTKMAPTGESLEERMRGAITFSSSSSETRSTPFFKET